MKLDRNDRIVAALAVLIAGAFVATAAGWGVPLIGDSHRWATLVILVLALVAGLVSAPGRDRGSNVLATLVVVAFLFAVLALASASLGALALLVAALFALVAMSTKRHARAARDPAASA
jgi:hypothetical protein